MLGAVIEPDPRDFTELLAAVDDETLISILAVSLAAIADLDGH